MKLFHAPPSPFVRKVHIAAIELGLIDELELIPIAVAPGMENKDYAQKGNPLRKIPALVRTDGSVLYDSGVICEYLDARAGGGRILPGGGEARWTMLRDHALANGICDAAVLIRYETWLRPEEFRWDAWTQDQWNKVNTGLECFEANPESCGDPNPDLLNIAQIGLACALGYMDFRYDERNWRGSYPKLSGWFAEVSKRRSIAETMPDAPAK
ncbi:glutathione S-transferase [Pelagibius sp. Alg239-R121]|uniref:glutathione S-transferase n=1 Tax=Pelagibius sp. Alg239-R121 TaxID=2993448 RepID=UPI0024A7A337|nr:glutathione S-transferase [Pelagibius sp. Alg239-R121]